MPRGEADGQLQDGAGKAGAGDGDPAARLPHALGSPVREGHYVSCGRRRPATPSRGAPRRRARRAGSSRCCRSCPKSQSSRTRMRRAGFPSAARKAASATVTAALEPRASARCRRPSGPLTSRRSPSTITTSSGCRGAVWTCSRASSRPPVGRSNVTWARSSGSPHVGRPCTTAADTWLATAPGRARPARPAGAARGGRHGRPVRPLHVGAAPDGSEDSRSEQATDVVLAVAGGAQSRGAVQHRFHAIERAAPRTCSDRATARPVDNRPTGDLWTTVAPPDTVDSHTGRRAGTQLVTLVPSPASLCERRGSCVRAPRSAGAMPRRASPDRAGAAGEVSRPRPTPPASRGRSRRRPAAAVASPPRPPSRPPPGHARSSARVTHIASAISPSAGRNGAPASASGLEADHQRARERPGLAAQVRDVADGDADLLVDLPQHAGLQRLPRLDEPGEHREPPLGPHRLAGEQDAVRAVVHQADHRRIGAGVVLVAVRLADPVPARRPRVGRRAVAAAEPGGVVPVQHRDGRGEQACAQRVQGGSGAAQVRPVDRVLPRDELGGIADGPVGDAVRLAEQHRVLRRCVAGGGHGHQARRAVACPSPTGPRAPARSTPTGDAPVRVRRPGSRAGAPAGALPRGVVAQRARRAARPSATAPAGRAGRTARPRRSGGRGRSRCRRRRQAGRPSRSRQSRSRGLTAGRPRPARAGRARSTSASPTMTPVNALGAKNSPRRRGHLLHRHRLQPRRDGRAATARGRRPRRATPASRRSRPGCPADQQRADGVAAGGVDLVGRRRHRDHPAQLVAGLQQCGGGDVAGDVRLHRQHRAPGHELRARVRAVGVALVLADVLHPARGEVAAEDEVRQLQRGVAASRRRSAGADRRSCDCTDPARCTSSRFDGAGTGGGRQLAARGAPPSSRRGAAPRARPRRAGVEVADDGEDRAAGHQARPCSARTSPARRRPRPGRSASRGRSGGCRTACAATPRGRSSAAARAPR